MSAVDDLMRFWVWGKDKQGEASALFRAAVIEVMDEETAIREEQRITFDKILDPEKYHLPPTSIRTKMELLGLDMDEVADVGSDARFEAI